MAVTADSVVVELVAKTGNYTAAINGASNTSQTALSKIEKSAAQAEVQVLKSSEAMGGALVRSANGIERGSARAAAATRNLGRQVSDIGVGLATGQNPFFVLAQQAPQVSDALADTGGKAARVAAFFAGPWGAALLAAGSALGILVGKALEGGTSVESLTAKLADNAEKSRLAAQAQAIFERSLSGAADASAKLSKELQQQNRSQIQVAQSALAAAVALRQQNLQNLRTETSRLALASATADAEARRARETSGLSAQRGENVALAASTNASIASGRAADARAKLAIANKALADSERAVVEASVPVLKLQAAELADKSAAATGRHERAVNKLTDAYRKAQAAAAKLPGEAGNAAREAAVRDYRSGVSSADRTLAAEQEAINESKRKGRRGPSEETLARRAEAERLKQIRQDSAFTQEKANLDDSLLSAQGRLAKSIEDQADAAIADAVSENNKRKLRYRNQQREGQLEEYERKELDAKSDAILAQQKVNIGLTKQEALDKQTLDLAVIAKSSAVAAREADLAMANDRQTRAKVEKDLLDLKYEERKLQVDANLADAIRNKDKVAEARARADLANLPSQKRADERIMSERNKGSYERYRDTFETIDGLAESIDRLKIGTLEAVTDELTRATTAALGLKGAFGQIVGELIRIGIQRSIIGPVADFLFGSAGGGGGGVGKILGGLFGRASGGYVGPGQTVRVNESRGGVELLRMGSTGGTVIPLGQANTSANRPAGASSQPAIVQLVVGAGQMFEPQVRAISGQVSIQTVQAVAPQIVDAATANTMSEFGRQRL